MSYKSQMTKTYRAMLEEGRKRRRKALALRERGKKFREIAEELGVTHQRAQQMVAKAIKERERAGKSS